MPKPTREDGRMILELSKMYPRDSARWFQANFSAKDYEEFTKKYPRGSQGFGRCLDMLNFFEMAGVLVSHGLLNEDLFFDLSFGLAPFWHKMGPVAKGWQKAVDPALWENAIWLADRQKVWAEKVWKPDLKWKLRAK